VSESTPPPPGGENQPPPPPPPPAQSGGAYQPPPPPPPGYGGAPAYGQPAYGPQKNNGKALWSMILGIVAIVFTLCCGIGFLAGIASIVLSLQAKKEIDASQGNQGGRGMATAGLVMGIISIALAALYFVLLATGTFNYNFSTDS
jgi:hypothetical protein